MAGGPCSPPEPGAAGGTGGPPGVATHAAQATHAIECSLLHNAAPAACGTADASVSSCSRCGDGGGDCGRPATTPAMPAGIAPCAHSAATSCSTSLPTHTHMSMHWQREGSAPRAGGQASACAHTRRRSLALATTPGCCSPCPCRHHAPAGAGDPSSSMLVVRTALRPSALQTGHQFHGGPSHTPGVPRATAVSCSDCSVSSRHAHGGTTLAVSEPGRVAVPCVCVSVCPCWGLRARQSAGSSDISHLLTPRLLAECCQRLSGNTRWQTRTLRTK